MLGAIMRLEGLPEAVQSEVLRLAETCEGLGVVEATMRLRALQELNELLGSEALFRLVAALTSAV